MPERWAVVVVVAAEMRVAVELRVAVDKSGKTTMFAAETWSVASAVPVMVSDARHLV